MSYMGRGDFSSFGGGSLGGELEPNDNENNNYSNYNFYNCKYNIFLQYFFNLIFFFDKYFFQNT